MGLIGLVFLTVALVLVGVGIAAGLVICGVVAGLVGVGVISSSFLIGLTARCPSAGFRAFLLQCGLLSGIPAGVVSALLARHLFTAPLAPWPSTIAGALGGAVAGMLVAFLIDIAARRTAKLVRSRL